jgi:hypothetical protein
MPELGVSSGEGGGKVTLRRQMRLSSTDHLESFGNSMTTFTVLHLDQIGFLHFLLCPLRAAVDGKSVNLGRFIALWWLTTYESVQFTK